MTPTLKSFLKPTVVVLLLAIPACFVGCSLFGGSSDPFEELRALVSEVDDRRWCTNPTP